MIQIEKVCTGSFTMNFFRFGKGEKTMVILPGLSIKSVMGSADAVRAEYALMEKDFTVYVFDRRAEIPSSYSVREMAEDTAEAFKTLDLHDIYLFGASQGGMIAMQIAIEHPELVSKLALGSSSAYVRDEQYRGIKKWIELAGKKDRVGLYLDFGKAIYPPEVFAQYRKALIEAGETVTDADLERFIVLAQGTKNFNAVDKINLIRCPVFAIGAYDDAVLGSDATAKIAEKLKDRPDFQLYMYDGFGHAAFDTAPDYRERLLQFFLQ